MARTHYVSMVNSEQAASAANQGGTSTLNVTSPIYRILAGLLASVSVFALGYYLNDVGLISEFSTIVVIAAFFSVNYWAHHRRPEEFQAKFGPFSKIAVATRDSIDDIRVWAFSRPWKAAIPIGVFQGLLVVLAKTILSAVFIALYSWELAVAVGAIVGALLAAPELFKSMFISVSDFGVGKEDAPREPVAATEPVAAPVTPIEPEQPIKPQFAAEAPAPVEEEAPANPLSHLLVKPKAPTE